MNQDLHPLPPEPGIGEPSRWRRLVRWLRQDIWDLDLPTLPRMRRLAARSVRVVHLVLRGFRHDECMLHASSLTFITLLAFVPVLALALSMARVFGAGDVARDQLKSVAREWLVESPALPGLPFATPPEPPGAAIVAEVPDGMPAGDVADRPSASVVAYEVIGIERIEELIDLGFERINSLNFSALGGIGLVFLLWTVISVLGRVEAAFNRVWGVTEQRPLHRKFTDYLSVLIVVPFLITVASTVPLAERIARWTHGAPIPDFGARAARMGFTMALLTLSFAFVLRFLPNTRVRPRPSLAGGLVTAVLSLGWLRICAAFQIGVARNSAFFGGFATVPILLSWVYVSWGILLFGAEVAFAVQNADTYRMEQGAGNASLRARLMVAVDLLAHAARALSTGDGLLRIPEYVAHRGISVRLVNDVVQELTQREFLVEVVSEPGAFAVRRDVLGMTVADVARAMLDSGTPLAALGLRCPPESPLCHPLNQAFSDRLSVKISQSPDVLGTLRNTLSEGAPPHA